MVLLILLSILLLNCQEAFGRRARTRSRSKSRVQIGLPITGKYRDPESDQYYNNNDVCKINRSALRKSLYLSIYRIILMYQINRRRYL